MKLELEDRDIEAIAQRVAELVKPLNWSKKKEEDDKIFDSEGLEKYLNVKRSWIYERTSRNSIPFIKKGQKLFFRKKAIDIWLQENHIPSVKK